MKKKLSIVIPTFNRCYLLMDCVESIIVSSQGFEDRFELIVSNDASTDETEEVVRTLQDKYPLIKYIRNEKNLYTDKHFTKIIENANFEFFWIIGDDDKITKNAMQEVFKQLDNDKNLIYCNYSVWNKDFSQIINENGLSQYSNIEFKNHDHILSTIAFNMGYISSVIGCKQHFTDIPISKRMEFDGFTMPQVYPLYAGQIKQSNAILIAETLIMNRAGNNSENKWHHIFVNGSNKIYKGLNKIGYSKKTIRLATFKVLLDYIIPHTVSLKIHKHNLYEYEFILLLKNYYSFPLFYLLCIIILIPNIFIKKHKKIIEKIPFYLKNKYGKI